MIARLSVGDLSEEEYFLKGEAHFLNLEPEPARDVFWEFRDRDDNLGRVAAQRIMIIRINAFSMVQRVVETDIPAYRQRYGARSDDRYGITFPVMRTAMQLAEMDRVDDALDLLVAEVKVHDKFDSPYTAYLLPQQFMELATKNHRGDEFRELHEWVVNNLDLAISQRFETTPQTTEQKLEISGIVFRSLFEDQEQDFHDWTADFLRLQAMLN